MKHLIILSILLFFTPINCDAQDYKYEFILIGVIAPVDAKAKIDDLRELLGVKTFFFDDVTNIFEMHTHLNYNLIELEADIESLGDLVDGIIIKTVL